MELFCEEHSNQTVILTEQMKYVYLSDLRKKNDNTIMLYLRKDNFIYFYDKLKELFTYEKCKTAIISDISHLTFTFKYNNFSIELLRSSFIGDQITIKNITVIKIKYNTYEYLINDINILNQFIEEIKKIHHTKS